MQLFIHSTFMYSFIHHSFMYGWIHVCIYPPFTLRLGVPLTGHRCPGGCARGASAVCVYIYNIYIYTYIHIYIYIYVDICIYIYIYIIKIYIYMLYILYSCMHSCIFNLFNMHAFVFLSQVTAALEVALEERARLQLLMRTPSLFACFPGGGAQYGMCRP